jgi:hypothetical protein
MTSQLEKYFKYKDEYLRKYDILKEFQLFEIRRTNMIINFYEIDRKYIAEIVDPDDRERVYYRKTLSYPENEQIINLSFLYDKLSRDLEMMNVDYNKQNYIELINNINNEMGEINIITNLQNTNNQLDNENRIKLETKKNELEQLQITFTEWLKNVENIMLRMDIIRDVYSNKIQNEINNMNEYTMSYYWLSNKLQEVGDNFHFVMSVIHTQGSIKNINDIVEYAGKKYIIKSISSAMLTIQELVGNSSIISVNIADIIHTDGTFIIFKDYSLLNGSILSNIDDVYKLPTDQATLVLSKLTYQEENWVIGDIVMYNGIWYIINSFNTNEDINIQNLENMELLAVEKSMLIHPIGYRKKYKNVNYTNELILPIEKWINTFSNVNQYYINNKQLYQGSDIKINSVVRYQNNWYIVVSISHPNITIRNLENKSDTNPKTVLINDVKYHEGYYNRYKNFKYATNVVIPIAEWKNKLNLYNIEYEDMENMIEKTEYPTGEQKDIYMRKETDEMIKMKLERETVKEIKVKEKEAKMTEEEKEGMKLKKELAKQKRDEMKKEKVRLSDEEKLAKELKKESDKLKKDDEKMRKKVVDDTGVTLKNIIDIYEDFIRRKELVKENREEFNKFIKEFGIFAKNSAILDNSEIANYSKNKLLPQVMEWIKEYKQLK